MISIIRYIIKFYGYTIFMNINLSNFAGKKNLKKLLDELANREMQSTELKISELMTKQKCNLKLMRSLNTSHR